MKRVTSGGGWPAIWYTIGKARGAGGVVRMIRALRSRNACKTCALGMGGQLGGMVNEAGRFPEVCKKSVQAMAADMQGRIRPGFFDEFSLGRLSRLTPRELEASGRLVEPLIAGPGDKTYRPIGWDEAIDRAAAAMKATRPEESFFYLSGRSSNEAAFLLQLVARLFGTNNVNNCSFFCHQASGVGLRSVTGSGTASVVLDDVGRCDLLFLIGGNPASNHPRLMRTLVDLKRAGGKIVVVNPLREVGLVNFKVPSDVRSLLLGSKIADEYVQPHIGGDIALLTGIAKAVLALGAVDEAFVTRHADAWDAFRDSIDAADWQPIDQASGVDRTTMERIARLYALSRRTIFCWTMGITHHEHGVQNVQMIANLAMMRAMLGRPGAGLLPLRGHSNVQGIGSMGAVPNLKWSVLGAMQDRFGVTLPTEPGLDTLACIERALDGRMRFGWCLGGNLYGSCPDSKAASRALSKIDTTVFLSTTLNTGHVHGRGRTAIILPVLARDEEPQSTTQESMFNYVRLSDGGRARYVGPEGRPLSEVEVIARVTRRVLGDRVGGLDLVQMEQHATIRHAIAAVVEGYDAIGRIDATKKEFHIEGRTFHEAKFKTETGRARFHVVPIPVLKATGVGHLRLMTIRSEGQFNTVVYEDEDIYRGQERRDVIMINPADMARVGLKTDDRLTVRTEVGQMDNVLARPVDIRAGNVAMYYPEANVLVSRSADPASRTPAFKSVSVQVSRSGRLPVLVSAGAADGRRNGSHRPG